MMISTLNLDLLNCVDLHDDKSYKMGLFDEWYEANFVNLAYAIKREEGLKLILDVNSFSNFEVYCKKLFLISDVLILRDTIVRNEKENTAVVIPVRDCRKEYPELKTIEGSLILKAPPHAGNWTSSSDKLKNNEVVPLAIKYGSYFSEQVYDWFLGSGREYISQGNIVYAPFIPSLEIEMAFFNKGYSFSDNYNYMPLYSKSYDWFDADSLKSLFLLNLPTLENIDIETINQIKQDDYDNYCLFRNEILNSIKDIKACYGKTNFMEEVRYIQRNRIDDNLNKLQMRMKRLKRMDTLRKMSLAIGAISIDIACSGTVTELTPILETATLGINEAIAQLQGKGELQENPCYFLWKINNLK